MGYFLGVHNGRKAFEREMLFLPPLGQVDESTILSLDIEPLYLNNESNERTFFRTYPSLNEEGDALILSEHPEVCGGVCTSFTLTTTLLQSIPLFAFNVQGEEAPLTLPTPEDFITRYYMAEVYMSDTATTETTIEISIPREPSVSYLDTVYVEDYEENKERYIERIVFF